MTISNFNMATRTKACHLCGDAGHLKRDCPQNDGTQTAPACHICGEVGHLKRDCPQYDASQQPAQTCRE